HGRFGIADARVSVGGDQPARFGERRRCRRHTGADSGARAAGDRYPAGDGGAAGGETAGIACAELRARVQADRNHVHHLMVRASPERKQIVLVIYFVAACFCGMALVVSISRSATLGFALVAMEVMV